MLKLRAKILGILAVVGFGFFASKDSIQQIVAPLPPLETKIFTLYLDSDFSASEKLAINDAAQLWTHTTKGRIKFKFIEQQVEFEPAVFATKSVIWRGSPLDDHLLIFERVIVGSEILGFAPPYKYVVLVPERVASLERFEIIAAHELGHHIGLQHIPSIMDPRAVTPCITKYDLEQFCELYGCRADDTTAKCIGNNTEQSITEDDYTFIQSGLE